MSETARSTGATTTARELLLFGALARGQGASSPRFTWGSYEKSPKQQREYPPPRADSRWRLTALGVRCQARTDELAQCATKL